MSKLRAILLALLLIVSPVTAWAQGHDDGMDRSQPTPTVSHSGDGQNHDDQDKDRGGDDEKDKDRDDKDDEDDGRGGDREDEEGDGGHHESISYDADYSFYGTVRWSGGEVIVGSRRLVGDNPWLRLLAPGMRVEVQGQVVGGAIKVKRLEVRYPRSWAFYEGPGTLVGSDDERVRVWFSGDDPTVFRLMAADDDELLLVACYRAGAWRELPEELVPHLSPSSWGWWLLQGEESGGAVRWRMVKKLPGDCR